MSDPILSEQMDKFLREQSLSTHEAKSLRSVTGAMADDDGPLTGFWAGLTTITANGEVQVAGLSNERLAYITSACSEIKLPSQTEIFNLQSDGSPIPLPVPSGGKVKAYQVSSSAGIEPGNYYGILTQVLSALVNSDIPNGTLNISGEWTVEVSSDHWSSVETLVGLLQGRGWSVNIPGRTSVHGGGGGGGGTSQTDNPQQLGWTPVQTNSETLFGSYCFALWDDSNSVLQINTQRSAPITSNGLYQSNYIAADVTAWPSYGQTPDGVFFTQFNSGYWVYQPTYGSSPYYCVELSNISTILASGAIGFHEVTKSEQTFTLGPNNEVSITILSDLRAEITIDGDTEIITPAYWPSIGFTTGTNIYQWVAAVEYGGNYYFIVTDDLANYPTHAAGLDILSQGTPLARKIPLPYAEIITVGAQHYLIQSGSTVLVKEGNPAGSTLATETNIPAYPAYKEIVNSSGTPYSVCRLFRIGPSENIYFILPSQY